MNVGRRRWLEKERGDSEQAPGVAEALAPRLQWSGGWLVSGDRHKQRDKVGSHDSYVRISHQ